MSYQNETAALQRCLMDADPSESTDELIRSIGEGLDSNVVRTWAQASGFYVEGTPLPARLSA